jgi:alkylated DNA repair dioxygenase AlkB
MNKNEYFEEHGYYVLKNAIGIETAKLLSKSFEMHKNVVEITAQKQFDANGFSGDGQVKNSFSQFGFIAFEALLDTMLPIMEEITGKTLYPTNSYARIYYNGAELCKHKDSESCEYAATITLDYDQLWDIWLTDLHKNSVSITLDRGDLCAYMGNKVIHWRETYSGQKQVQVFLFYVDANGPSSNLKFYGRKCLGMPL